jgi:hypothetical protein
LLEEANYKMSWVESAITSVVLTLGSVTAVLCVAALIVLKL